MALVEPAAEPPQAEPAPSAEPVKIAAQAAAIAAPVATATIRTAAAPVSTEAPQVAGMTVAQLRRLCSESGIKWRNVHGKSKHLKRAEMIDAILA